MATSYGLPQTTLDGLILNIDVANTKSYTRGSDSITNMVLIQPPIANDWEDGYRATTGSIEGSPTLQDGLLLFDGTDDAIAFRDVDNGRIGDRNYNSAGETNHFNGDIGQVNIYDRALTAGEILQNYNATKHRFGRK